MEDYNMVLKKIVKPKILKTINRKKYKEPIKNYRIYNNIILDTQNKNLDIIVKKVINEYNIELKKLLSAIIEKISWDWSNENNKNYYQKMIKKVQSETEKKNTNYTSNYNKDYSVIGNWTFKFRNKKFEDLTCSEISEIKIDIICNQIDIACKIINKEVRTTDISIFQQKLEDSKNTQFDIEVKQLKIFIEENSNINCKNKNIYQIYLAYLISVRIFKKELVKLFNKCQKKNKQIRIVDLYRIKKTDSINTILTKIKNNKIGMQHETD